MSRKPAKPETQLKRAITNGNVDEARRLYADGVEPDGLWIYDLIFDNKVDGVRLMLDFGFDPVAPNPKRNDSAAEYAVMQGRLEPLKIMLDYGFDLNPNAMTEGGLETLFQDALSYERVVLEYFEGEQACRTAIVDLLIDQGADLQVIDYEGYGVVARAMREDQQNHVGRAKKLEALGASIRGVACWQFVQRFREDDSKMVADDLKGLEPEELSLLLGSLTSRPDLIPVAIELGADPDFYLSPALPSAAQSGKLGAVIALLDAGADINLRDRDGMSALSWAQMNGHQDVVDLLRERGAKTINTKPYAKRRGVEDVEGNVWSLSVMADADTTALAACSLIGGHVVKDVLRQQHMVSQNYAVVVQFKGHPWTHVLSSPTIDRRLLEKRLAKESGLEALVLDCAKTAGIASYRYWLNGSVAESYSAGDQIDFTTTLGTKKPRRSSRPESAFDRAFKRFDAWAIETGLVSGRDKDGALLIDIAYTNLEDFEAVHLVSQAD